MTESTNPVQASWKRVDQYYQVYVVALSEHHRTAIQLEQARKALHEAVGTLAALTCAEEDEEIAPLAAAGEGPTGTPPGFAANLAKARQDRRVGGFLRRWQEWRPRWRASVEEVIGRLNQDHVLEAAYLKMVPLDILRGPYGRRSDLSTDPCLVTLVLDSIVERDLSGLDARLADLRLVRHPGPTWGLAAGEDAPPDDECPEPIGDGPDPELHADLATRGEGPVPPPVLGPAATPIRLACEPAARDVVTPRLDALFALWHKEFGSVPVTAAAVARMAEHVPLFRDILESINESYIDRHNWSLTSISMVLNGLANWAEVAADKYLVNCPNQRWALRPVREELAPSLATLLELWQSAFGRERVHVTEVVGLAGRDSAFQAALRSLDPEVPEGMWRAPAVADLLYRLGNRGEVAGGRYLANHVDGGWVVRLEDAPKGIVPRLGTVTVPPTELDNVVSLLEALLTWFDYSTFSVARLLREVGQDQASHLRTALSKLPSLGYWPPTEPDLVTALRPLVGHTLCNKHSRYRLDEAPDGWRIRSCPLSQELPAPSGMP